MKRAKHVKQSGLVQPFPGPGANVRGTPRLCNGPRRSKDDFMTPPVKPPTIPWLKPWKDPRVFFLWLIVLPLLAVIPSIVGHTISAGALRFRALLWAGSMVAVAIGILGLLLSL